MFNPIIIVLKRTARVVWRVNEDTLNLAGELLFERFEGEQIVAEDEAVIEVVVVRDPLLGVIRILRVFEQDARLQPGLVLFPNPMYETYSNKRGQDRRACVMVRPRQTIPTIR